MEDLRQQPADVRPTLEGSIRLLTGSANRALAEEISRYVEVPLGQIHVNRFADGEVSIAIGESVRGKDVYVIQSLSAPVNDHIMEMLVMVDALRRSSARTITAVIPYYAYARQDRQAVPRTPISAKLLADLLTTSGVNRVMAMDLHAGQIQGFFTVPFDHLYATNVLNQAMRRLASDPERCVVVSPDAGGVDRARRHSAKLGVGLAIIDKRRPRANVAEVMHVIGEVEGRDAFIIDDMIDTAGTLCSAARALKDNGARTVCAFATHGLFNGAAVERIRDSALSAVYVTNTIPPGPGVVPCDKIHYLSVAETIGEAIKRVHGDTSVSSLFWG